MCKIDYSKAGIIFNIQKFSVHDGPGIRTVVFLKGCPLNCKWCSNPESQLSMAQVLCNHANCTKCKACTVICPSRAIELLEDNIHIDTNKCTGCNLCVLNCKAKVLKMEGSKKTVQEVIDIVMQDKVFYEESGGGITLSGGEMLSQPDFAIELLLAAKDCGLHTCCETTGFAKQEVFDRVIENIDYLLFDIKHWDQNIHLYGTGVSNQLPLLNIKSAIRHGKNVLTRIPIIPGFNDSLEDALEFTKLLHKLNLSKCQLLPFHQFGENKYVHLNMSYAYKDIPSLHASDLTEYIKIFINNNIDAFF